MLAEGTIKRVLAEALAAGGDLAELFVEDRSSTGLRLEDRRVEDVASGRDAGAGVRVVAGERSSYAYTNLLTEEGLVETARAARAGLSGDAASVADLTRTNPPVEHPVRTPPAEVAAADKVEALRAADDAARSAGGEVRQVVASYADVRQKVLIADSDGRLVEDDRTRVRFVCQVVAARDGQISTGFRAPGHSGGFELFDAFPAAEVGAVAAEKAITMLDARPSP
ncbi:MAG: TldD/PmbA family protein, partial [Actinomycetota bacterium]|nr:TldD/PmbA family protein [Actinomycetota bacterium]